MSSIMRSRSALTGGCEGWEVIGQILSSRRLQDLRCSGADAPTVTPERSNPHRERDDLQARALPRQRVRSLARSRTPASVSEATHALGIFRWISTTSFLMPSFGSLSPSPERDRVSAQQPSGDQLPAVCRSPILGDRICKNGDPRFSRIAEACSEVLDTFPKVMH